MYKFSVCIDLTESNSDVGKQKKKYYRSVCIKDKLTNRFFIPVCICARERIFDNSNWKVLHTWVPSTIHRVSFSFIFTVIILFMYHFSRLHVFFE